MPSRCQDDGINWQGTCECHPKLGTTSRDARRGLVNLTIAGMGPHRVLMHATKMLSARMMCTRFATQLMQHRRGLIRGSLHTVKGEKITPFKRAVRRKIDHGGQRRQRHSLRKFQKGCSSNKRRRIARGLFNTQAKHRELLFVINTDSQLYRFIHGQLQGRKSALVVTELLKLSFCARLACARLAVVNPA
jgi:hypothetical protein